LMQGHVNGSSERGCLMIGSKYRIVVLGPILTIGDIEIRISNLGSKDEA
jgi:hypothetical protein